MRISDGSSDVCSSDLFQVRPGDGKPVSLLVEHDRGERFQRPLGETLAFKREAERHGEAAGVGSGDQFFGVGSALLLEAAAEAIGRFLKDARASRDGARALLSKALIASGDRKSTRLNSSH